MPRVAATVVVPLDPQRTFLLSQTYGELRYRWDPFVREQRLLDGAAVAAKGVKTWTRSRHRLTMVSEYVTYRPPRHVGMRMVTGPWFFRSFSGGWNFTATDDGGTEATWRYNFTCRPAWLAPLADRVGIWLLGRDVRRRIAAFARACIDPDILSRLPEVEAEAETAPTEQPASGASSIGGLGEIEDSLGSASARPATQPYPSRRAEPGRGALDGTKSGVPRTRNFSNDVVMPP